MKTGEEPPTPHESYADAAPTVPFDNLNCRFEPHICLLTTKQTLVVGNQDPVGHNTKIDMTENSVINENLPSKATIEKQFEKPERAPAAVSCSVHPWMRGYLLVRESPYFAVSDENGSFHIANLPTGRLKFQMWHEKNVSRKSMLGGRPKSGAKDALKSTSTPAKTIWVISNRRF